MSGYSRYSEAQGRVDASRHALFDFLDDHANLGAHMSRPSGMMFGSIMKVQMDHDRTRRVGSRFGFEGRVLGLPLEVQEVVIARDPPVSKRWETTSEPRLWVIGRYQMGFALTPTEEGATQLHVDIEYELPARGLARLLGRLFASVYAKWCTEQMVTEAQRHFEKRVAVDPPATTS